MRDGATVRSGTRRKWPGSATTYAVRVLKIPDTTSTATNFREREICYQSPVQANETFVTVGERPRMGARRASLAVV
jgi:hypothetical protein